MVTSTLQPTNQCPRPADCPACVRNTQEACGIKTVTASQIGAVAALVVGGIFFALQVVFPSSPLPSQNSLLPQEGGFADEFWVILCISAVYYAVAEWDAEECRYHELRLVQWPTFMKWNWLRTKPLAKLSYWEFWIRVGLAATFGAAAAGVPEYLRFGMTEVHSSCLLLAWIYVGF